MAIQTFPLDIQTAIMESVFMLSQHASIDYPTLLACALVCRAWRGIAQSLLLRRVPYPDGDDHRPNRLPSIHLLLHTLRTNPRLAAHVRVVHIHLWDYRNSITQDNDSLSLLELCPHVTGIVFDEGSLNKPSVDMDMEARPRAIPLQPVSLKVSGDQMLVSRIIEMWPSVRALEVYVHSTRYNPPLLPIPSSIEALTLSTSDAHKIILPNNGFPALRHLQVVYNYSGRHDANSNLRALASFSRLKTLHISGYFPPQEAMDELEQVESIVCDKLPEQAVVLPRTLRHFGYHPWGRQQQDTSFLAPALRTANSLQLFTCTWAEVLKMVEHACRDRGIEFAFYTWPNSFPTALDVDWI
ncbi:hypothetical protein FA95DRAFT_1682994 [Auriscalpium vulgare]|uniref:Uncharacterized protein n=1 Tax=Auriscalpium vulgare TaxID=40419 RepID=A0ACB8RDU5_9AGAM|nr:hypothetical protein FA95DRAFT_1682994 [Auriscalpium vulgare]